MPDTQPTKEAMEAARKVHRATVVCLNCRDVQGDCRVVDAIAAALNAYAAEQNMVSIAAGQAFARELQSVEAERDAALAARLELNNRCLAAEDEARKYKQHHLDDLVRLTTRYATAEERVRALESWRAKAINLYPELDDRASLLAGETR